MEWRQAWRPVRGWCREIEDTDSGETGGEAVQGHLLLDLPEGPHCQDQSLSSWQACYSQVPFSPFLGFML